MDFNSKGPSMDQPSNEIFWSFIAQIFVKEIDFQGIEILLEKKDKPVFYIGQHGAALGWLALALANRVFWSHQQVDRPPGIIFHPFVYQMPLLKNLAFRFSSGHKITNFFQLIKLIERGKILEVGSCPESSNCNFLYDEPVAPFKFKEWIHLAMKIDKDIVLVVHSGTEQWQKTWKWPFSLGSLRGVHIPFMTKKIERLRLKMIPYEPPFSGAEFKQFTKKEQESIVDEECEKIREIMINEWKILDAS